MSFLREFRRILALYLVLLVVLPAGVPELKLCVAGGLCASCGNEATTPLESEAAAAAPCRESSDQACCAGVEETHEAVRPASDSAPLDDCNHCCLSLSDPASVARGGSSPSLEAPVVDVVPEIDFEVQPMSRAGFASAAFLPEARAARPPSESRAPPASVLS